ncbi:MAG TPA: ELWxxDGT repeat protein, partial [Candidatus Saccharimonadales bacterium]|nr:ELWxxDGT repeat protein [Candidatus Saccharimonadales bacterium]
MIAAAGFLWAGVPAFAAGGPAHVLRDINLTPSYEMGSSPMDFARVGDMTLLLGWTMETGFELWRTDGTEDGTAFVKDIWPGPDSGVRFVPGVPGALSFEPAVLNGEAFFVASDGVHGWELWKSDGTEDGTAMLKEIRPGAAGPFDGRINASTMILNWRHVEAGGLLYFLADDGEHGFEVWRTDGTEGGTYLLKDINPGSSGAFSVQSSGTVSGFNGLDVRGELFFTADDGVHGNELWKTDGTPGGTVLVKDILPGAAGSYPRLMAELRGMALFWPYDPNQGSDPWISDGTAAGTVRVKDFLPGPSAAPSKVVELNGRAIFTEAQYLLATDGTLAGSSILHVFYGGGITLHGAFNGRVLLTASTSTTGGELWVTDGTANGTLPLRDIYPGTPSSFPTSVVGCGNRVLFLANDGVHGRELWTTDLTEAGTMMVLDFKPGPADGGVVPRAVNGICYFIGDDGSGQHLWRTDGTAAGTTVMGEALVSSVAFGEAPGGALLMAADDGIHGFELWRSDGTAQGTSLVKDLNTLIRTEPSDVDFLGVVSGPGTGDRMLFSAIDTGHGRELWMTDGTTAGTRLLKDIRPGPDDSILNSSGKGALVHEGVVYFAASDGVHGRELWRSDGTEAGTVLVSDIRPGPADSSPGSFVEFDGSIWFAADDGVNGFELWKSDGTGAGTVLAVETEPGPGSFGLQGLFALGDTLYFTGYSPTTDLTLWRSDGSQAGTFPINDSANIDGPLFPGAFVGLGDRLFFTAFDVDHWGEPWVSDGTEAGTYRIADIRPGQANSRTASSPAAALGGFVYFAARDASHGEDLWRTDGTEAGTIRLVDLSPEASSSGIGSMTVLDGTLYFTAGRSGPTSTDLWRSDGTEAGTVPVAAGLGGFYGNLDASAGGLLFSSRDPDHGVELWRSDGTEAGTVLAQDLFPGPRNSTPRNFAEMGDRVFFLADDLHAGIEPWVARSALLLGRPDQAFVDLIGEVRALDLPSGLSTSLTVKLDAAVQAFTRRRAVRALQLLGAFANQVSALTPKWIAPAASEDLLEFTTGIADLLAAAPPV